MPPGQDALHVGPGHDSIIPTFSSYTLLLVGPQAQAQQVCKSELFTCLDMQSKSISWLPVTGRASNASPLGSASGLLPHFRIWLAQGHTGHRKVLP